MNKRLLFLPGAGGDPAFWRPLGQRLPDAWEMIYLGWPGLGDQPHDPAVKGFDDLVARVEDQMGDGAVDLLAQSMGGVVAMSLALRHPGRVRKLVLAVTSGGVDAAALAPTNWRETYPQNYPRAASWILNHRIDLTPQIHRLACPTLLLWGDADPISPIAVGEQLRSLIPQARLHIVPGGDHGFVQDRPEAICDVIRDHLA